MSTRYFTDSTQRERVRLLLTFFPSLTSLDFIDQGILSYSACIHELRDEGYDIETTREDHGVFRYELVL